VMTIQNSSLGSDLQQPPDLVSARTRLLCRETSNARVFTDSRHLGMQEL